MRMSDRVATSPTDLSLVMSQGSYVVLSLVIATVALIGVVWWPLLSDYLSTVDPNHPWWHQVDWLLLGIFGLMTVLIVVGANLRRDAAVAAVALGGGLVIESWGTQTGLWTYYTLGRPPLWILPAWPVAALAIDRLTSLIRRAIERLTTRQTTLIYLAVFIPFMVLMVNFVWHTRYATLTIAALGLCAFIIATPVRARTTLAIFAAGAGLGFLLELWGTTRLCWTYYNLETPPLFAVLAHGMAAVAFWRTGEALGLVLPHIPTWLRRLGRFSPSPTSRG